MYKYIVINLEIETKLEKEMSSSILDMEPSTRDPQRKVRLAIDVFYFMKIIESDDKCVEAMRNTSDRISRVRIIQCHLADGESKFQSTDRRFFAFTQPYSSR